jgi:hypothetical protein
LAQGSQVGEENIKRKKYIKKRREKRKKENENT